MGYETFGEFILELHAVNKEAAKFVATQCLKKEKGEPVELVWCTSRGGRKPISQWKRGDSLHNLFIWGEERQFAPRQPWTYWNNLKSIMKEREREHVD